MTADHVVLSARLELELAGAVHTINRNVYGHFAEHLGRCIEEGIWVGEESQIANVRGIREDVITALRVLEIPVLRWPGGCFADEYHWRDGIGPRESRPRRINTHWGGVTEKNHFGTHEFLDLCELTGAAPYVCGNVGSGSVREMREWVEYMTHDSDSSLAELRRQNGRAEPWQVPYFGVGNECWGCGGSMRAGYYADLYRRYATFVKSYSGNRIERIACGSAGEDYEWTEVLMERCAGHMQGLSLHWYTLPTSNWQKKGSATQFGEDEWHSTLVRALRMDELITKHSAIMDRFDEERKVGLVVDEWGTWYDVEPGTNPGFLYQQNTLRDALVAAVTLNVFHHHARRVSMANLAQTVNVLQAVLLTEGAALVKTPTYHVFEMFKVHQGGTLVPSSVMCPDYRLGDAVLPMVHASASRSASGVLDVSLCNLDPTRSVEVAVTPGFTPSRARLLTAETMNAHNTFERPDEVAPVAFSDFSEQNGALCVVLPPKSVLVLSA